MHVSSSRAKSKLTPPNPAPVNGEIQNLSQRKNGSAGVPRTIDSQSLSPTRVVLEDAKLAKWCENARWNGFMVLQCPGTFEQMLTQCQKLAPCVLIVSQEVLESSNGNGLNAWVRVENAIRILVLASRKGPNLAEKFLAMGCMGYLRSDASTSTVTRAVRAVASGQVWANRSTIAHVMCNMILQQVRLELTSRERDILRLIAGGLNNRVIADRLFISHETVRWHIRRLYSKLGFQNRSSAIFYAKRLFDSESPPMEPAWRVEKTG
jgi:DNA-binding NarL/FixJ family response regulator